MRVSILALDLGDNCGWCTLNVYSAKGYILRHGVWRLKPSRFDSASVRFDKFGNNVEKELLVGTTHVAYEQVRFHKGIDAAHVYGGYSSKLLSVCDAASNMPCQSYPVQTIKKFATGKGNASKSQMMKAASRYAGTEIENDNEADAICIAMLHFDMLL